MGRIATYIDPYMEIGSDDPTAPLKQGSEIPDRPLIHSSHKSDESQKAQLILCVGSILLFILVGCILNCIRTRHLHFRKLIRSWSQYDKKNNYLNIDDSIPETAGERDIPTVISTVIA